MISAPVQPRGLGFRLNLRLSMDTQIVNQCRIKYECRTREYLNCTVTGTGDCTTVETRYCQMPTVCKQMWMAKWNTKVKVYRYC